jgi:signal transduction histidine kinase
MDVIKVLRIAVVLWLVYLGLSAAIDFALKSPGRVQEYYYLTSAVISLFILLLTIWPQLRKRLKGVFLPVVITLICVLPTAVNQVAVHYFFPSLQGPPEALLNRVAPFLLIALILVAWQYRWQHLLIFCALIAVLNVGILFSFSGQNEIGDGLFAILTQVMSFLIVGFFINVLVRWLRRQSRSLEEANAKLASYAQTLEDLTVSRERTRLAQELHDTLSHTLSGLSVQLETIKAYWKIDLPVAREVLEKAITATRSGLEETRRALLALRARPLEELGLAGALLHVAAEAAQRGGMKLQTDIAEGLPALPMAAEQGLFRVAQEAMTNAARHSKADILSVSLKEHGGRLVLTVHDNGVGFNADTEREGGLGVTGMRERARVLGGYLDISSEGGKGTTVRLTIQEGTT